MLSAKGLRRCFWGVALCLGLIQAAARRHSLSTEDGISYLDVADAYLRGDWQTAINGCWSPLYSWMLAGPLGIFRPDPQWEFVTVKGVNFLIFCVALLCFEYFMREFLQYYENRLSGTPVGFSYKIPEHLWRIAGYMLFLWASLFWIRVDSSTPDLLTSALLYLATALQLRILSSSTGYVTYFFFGIVLGLGYLSKAAIFPLALVYVVSICPFSIERFRRAAGKIVLACISLLVICAPFIFALSSQKGRFTINDAGKMNYAWFVSPGKRMIPGTHWQGGPPGSGIPVHPTRMIHKVPEAYEFAVPVGGTYPPWYDPSYWYEGLVIPFNMQRQISTIVRNGYFYFRKFFSALAFGYFVLIFAGGGWFSSLTGLARNWRFLLPPVAGLVLYGSVMDLPASFFELQPTTRYVGAFAVLLFAAVFSTVRLPYTSATKKILKGWLAIAILLPGIPLLVYSIQDLQSAGREQNHAWQIANKLRQEGLPEGARVAVIGKGYQHQFWARLARVKVIAEVPDHVEFWTSSPQTRSQVQQLLFANGAEAIISNPFPVESVHDSNWRQIPSTRLLFYLPEK